MKCYIPICICTLLIFVSCSEESSMTHPYDMERSMKYKEGILYSSLDSLPLEETKIYLKKQDTNYNSLESNRIRVLESQVLDSGKYRFESEFLAMGEFLTIAGIDSSWVKKYGCDWVFYSEMSNYETSYQRITYLDPRGKIKLDIYDDTLYVNQYYAIISHFRKDSSITEITKYLPHDNTMYTKPNTDSIQVSLYDNKELEGRGLIKEFTITTVPEHCHRSLKHISIFD